jgi:hypothetical protein
LTPWQQQFVVSIHEQLVELGEDRINDRQRLTLFGIYRDWVEATIRAQDNLPKPQSAAALAPLLSRTGRPPCKRIRTWRRSPIGILAHFRKPGGPTGPDMGNETTPPFGKSLC